MAPEKNSAGEKTEEATPRRREEARKKGQVAKSNDLNSALNLFAVLMILYYFQGFMSLNIQSYFSDFFSHRLLMDTGDLPQVFFEAGTNYLIFVLPVLLGAFVIALVANIAQVGFKITPEALKPKWERFNVLEGFKRMFSLKTLVELAKNIVKITVVALVVYSVVKKRIPQLFWIDDVEIYALVGIGKNIIFSIALSVAITYLAIAVLDFFYQKYEHKKSLRMTKQEIKEEYKTTEGDPQIKARIKERQRQISLRRMVQEVPKATVVVTNPTHFAVALKYDREEMDAPMLVAKGADLMAERIKETAREHQVPLVENKPVAQFLYHKVEVGAVIPDQLYQAVAEILAVVYQQK